MSTATPARRVLLMVSAVWAALVLALYYERLWRALAAGPSAWDIGTLAELRYSGFPYVGEAATRAAVAVAVAGMIAAAMITAGRLADRWLTPSGLATHERLVIRFANGAALLSLLLLGLAGAGAYSAAIVRIVVLALAGIGAALAIRSTRDANAMPRSGAPGPRAARLWIGVSALAGAIAFVTALAPETEYDALWYHLELPRRWLAAGRLTDNVHEYVSLYPGSWELLFGAALAFDSPVAARLLHWMTLAAGAVAASSIAARALGRGTGPLAAAVFVTAPTILWEGTTAYVDLALAMHAGIGIAALWQSTRDRDSRWLAVAGLQLGMACATKHLGLAIAAIGIGACFVAAARRGRLTGLRAIAFVGFLTLLIPAPWYVRAWKASGNPVFPEMYSVFGAHPAERWNDETQAALDGFKAHFGRPRSAATIAALPWDMTLHAWRYGGTFGPLLLLTLPAMALVVWRSRPARWLAGGALAYLAIWASPISSFQLRFLVPWWLFVSVLVSGSIALLGAATRARAAVAAVTAILLLLNLPPFIPLHERDRVGWDRWLTHVVHRVPVEVVAGGTSADEHLSSQIRSYAAWRFLNAHAPADARVLTFFGGDHFYTRRERLWSESPAAQPATWSAIDETANVFTALRQLGITHLLVPIRPPVRTEAHEDLLLLRPEVLARFPLEYEDYWAAVYRVGRTPAETPVPDADAAGPGVSIDQR